MESLKGKKNFRMAAVYSIFAVGITVTHARNCKSGTVANYNMTLNTLWSKAYFPKQYPLYRPPPSWSSLIGRTHNEHYVLWREGELASPGLKQLAEVGKTDLLDVESQGHDGVLDVFKVPAIQQGVGTSHTNFFVDSNHPRISLASHITPSPDWFVGVDSVMFCDNGQWIPEMSLDLGPWDAGTDKGFTFTAPNWPDVPQQPISPITSQFPDHPANGFYYPDKAELPPLAKVTFKLIGVRRKKLKKMATNTNRRVGTYRLEQGTDEVYENVNSADNSGEVYNSYKNVADQPNVKPHHEPIVYEELPTPKRVNAPVQKGNEVSSTQAKSSRRRRPKGGRGSKKSGKKMGRRPNGRKEDSVVGSYLKVDCEVSAWTNWAPCSKTCGFGTRTRRRYVAQKPQKGGNACPPLVEDELCGSMRTCGWKHFRFGSVFKN